MSSLAESPQSVNLPIPPDAPRCSLEGLPDLHTVLRLTNVPQSMSHELYSWDGTRRDGEDWIVWAVGRRSLPAINALLLQHGFIVEPEARAWLNRMQERLDKRAPAPVGDPGQDRDRYGRYRSVTQPDPYERSAR